MTDRQKELQRQRALVQEQLAWLDREIAREAGTGPVATPAAPTATPVTPPAMVPPGAPPGPASSREAAARAEAEAEAMMAEYRRDPESLQSSVKKGCILYFIGAFALLALGLVAWYFLQRGR
ncbi:MAG TPA: hypothetical protein VG936_09570 [Lacunisphaera sp.]|nr:hypothetical protein [Lacunisphaera sp.]